MSHPGGVVTEPSFQHVIRLSDDVGIFEHAEGSVPRRHLGYCLDDVARALVVTLRQADPSSEVRSLAGRYLAFVGRAQAPDGRFHNRLRPDRTWADAPGVADWWGRALWALGTAAARGLTAESRREATRRFELSAHLRSPHSRSMAFAALGAAEILAFDPGHRSARQLLTDAVTLIGRPGSVSEVGRPGSVSEVGRPGRAETWRWPEPRLRYANAALAEVVIAGGEHLGDRDMLADGLDMLGWLLDTESLAGHLSITPVGGWSLGETRPGFDQQPIEVAALADACLRAWRVTGDARWATAVTMAVDWFLGDNDAGCALYEPNTGGGYDGLEPRGCNSNQGAESTLAMVATFQAGHLLAGR